MGVEEGGAAGGEAVEVWGLGERMSAQMPDPVVLIVDGDEHDVRLGRPDCPGNACKR